MLEFSTVQEWKQVFGKDYEDAVFELVDTHHLFRIREDKVYFSVGLHDLFDDQMDLWSVDPELVDDSVQLAMVFSDSELNPDVLTNLIDYTEDKLGYSPVDNTGGFSIKVADLRRYYGEEEFDREMEELFPGHTKWWNSQE
jgi:hypothetical protein